MDVGIRELKARLSEFLERAARGEVIRVTDRGKPKAILTGIPDRQRDPVIERGIREGWIQPGNGAPPNFDHPRFKGRITIQEALDEDRGD